MDAAPAIANTESEDDAVEALASATGISLGEALILVRKFGTDQSVLTREANRRFEQSP